MNPVTTEIGVKSMTKPYHVIGNQYLVFSAKRTGIQGTVSP